MKNDETNLIDDNIIKKNKFNINGYVAYYLPNHHLANKAGLVYEHILIAEQILKRRLDKEEVVHHKDFNRSNNNQNNLMVFKTKEDHSRFHKTGECVQLQDKTYISPISNKKICPKCGNNKSIKANLCLECYKKYKTEYDFYCSNPHSSRKSHRPSREKLKDDIRNNSYLQVGRIYSVSDNAVRKWCDYYNLPRHSREINLYSDEEWEMI